MLKLDNTFGCVGQVKLKWGQLMIKQTSILGLVVALSIYNTTSMAEVGPDYLSKPYTYAITNNYHTVDDMLTSNDMPASCWPKTANPFLPYGDTMIFYCNRELTANDEFGFSYASSIPLSPEYMQCFVRKFSLVSQFSEAAKVVTDDQPGYATCQVKPV